MARRPKGDGSIRQRADGRWEARIVIEEGGRRRRRSFFGTTQAEARRKMRDAERRAELNLPIPSEKLTVAAYIESWLEGKRGALGRESWRRYEGRARRIIEHVGDVKLAKLQPAHLREAYAAIGAEVSGTTVQLCHGVIHSALRDAEREGLVARNVASLVTPPRRTTPEMRALQPEDARALLTAARDDPLEAFFTVALTCGLRLGELQALQWRDIDVPRRRLTVRRTLAGVDNGIPVFSPSSTRKNHQRTVWLSDRAVEALHRHQERQSAQRTAAGDAWHERNLVFTNGVGNPLDGRNLRRRDFPRIVAKAGIPPMRIHDMRHSAASLLLADGVPVKVVSEILGHADVATTLRIYAHVLEGAQAQAVGVMDRLFHG